MENGQDNEMQEVVEQMEFPPLRENLNHQVMHSCLTCFNVTKLYCDCLNLCMMASELVNKSGSGPIYSFIISNHAYKRPNFGLDRESNSFDKVKSPSRTLRYPNEFLCFFLDDIDDFIYNLCDFNYENDNLLFVNKNYKKRESKK